MGVGAGIGSGAFWGPHTGEEVKRIIPDSPYLASPVTDEQAQAKVPVGEKLLGGEVPVGSSMFLPSLIRAGGLPITVCEAVGSRLSCPIPAGSPVSWKHTSLPGPL